MRPSPELCGNVVIGSMGVLASVAAGAGDLAISVATAVWVAILCGQAAGELP